MGETKLQNQDDRECVLELLKIIENNTKYDFGNMKWYYIAGDEELTKALCKCKELFCNLEQDKATA